MSNQLAIATVTAAIRLIVDTPIGAEVGGATAVAARPRSEGADLETDPGISIFLYGVTPHTAYRPTGEDLPTRRANGELAQRPRQGFELSYLLIAYGNPETHEPERLLGVAVRELHAHPIVDRDLIGEIRDAADPPPPTPPVHAHLAGTDLDDEIELAKLTQVPLDLDEMSKLWGAFQAPYAPSLAYRASVVFIDAELGGTASLPVLTKKLYTVPLRAPVIEAVEAAAGADRPIVATSTITVHGRNLRGDQTLVRVAGEELPATAAQNTRVTAALSAAGSLKPGLQTLRIVQQRLMGEPPTPHVGVSSNQTTFTLHPTVNTVTLENIIGADAAFDGDAVVDVDLVVAEEQQVVLRLLDVGTEAMVYRSVGPQRTGETTSLTLPFSGLSAGTYLVQVEIDGAVSPLERDTSGVATGPSADVQ